jgi:hypothetical protein
MSEGSQQQGGQQQQQEQQSPVQNLTQALTGVRKVQSMFELNYPQQGQAIQMLRNAGDLVWQEIERMQQQQQG